MVLELNHPGTEPGEDIDISPTAKIRIFNGKGEDENTDYTLLANIVTIKPNELTDEPGNIYINFQLESVIDNVKHHKEISLLFNFVDNFAPYFTLKIASMIISVDIEIANFDESPAEDQIGNKLNKFIAEILTFSKSKSCRDHIFFVGMKINP